jgi:hypothetical protein
MKQTILARAGVMLAAFALMTSAAFADCRGYCDYGYTSGVIYCFIECTGGGGAGSAPDCAYTKTGCLISRPGGDKKDKLATSLDQPLSTPTVTGFTPLAASTHAPLATQMK